MATTPPFDIHELRTLVQARREVRYWLENRPPGSSGAGPFHGGGRPSTRARPHPAPVEAPCPDASFIDQVCAVVEARMGDTDLTVEELARRTAHSRGHLHRRLTSLIGESPSDLIRRMRLERAAALLEARTGSVSRIACTVGFKSLAHFSNRFSEHFGVRPSRYRSASTLQARHQQASARVQ